MLAVSSREDHLHLWPDEHRESAPPDREGARVIYERIVDGSFT